MDEFDRNSLRSRAASPRFVKMCIFLMSLPALAAAGFIVCAAYTQPPGEHAGRPRGETSDSKTNGEIVRAVELYHQAAVGGNRQAAEQLKTLLEEWLSAPEQGRKKLAGMLAAEKRSYEVLMFVGRMLRASGAKGEACSLIEEAYGKVTDNLRKFAAASTRALLATEVDEKIVWLRRADPNNAEVNANLCEALAERAFQDGKTAEAETHLRRAIELYTHMPRSAPVLNNTALAHFSLYRITSDRRWLDKAVTMLDDAVALAPNSSILLGNAVDVLLDAAVRDLVSDRVDLKKLERSGESSLLPYLYAEQQGKRRLLEKLCTHPATVKATSFLERLLVLAPRDIGVYRQLRNLYAARQDADKLSGLLARLEKGAPDLSAQEAMVRAYFAGQKDERIRKEAEAQQDRYARLVKELEAGRRGVTYAVAATELAAAKMTLDGVGRPADVDEVVALVESAHAAAPSDATRRALEVVLLFRANRNLARKNPAFAALDSRTRRSLEAKDHIAAALMHEGAMRQTVLADADVKRALDLVRQSRRQFPDDPSKWAWIVLRAADAGEAAQLAKVIRDDPIERVLQTIDWKLAPFSAGIALRTCWSLQVAGKAQEGAAILKQCAARGTPIPDLP